jgi:hypothetical protein
MTGTRTAGPDTEVAVANLIKYLETGQPPEDLYAPDVFIDVSLPHWRLQADTAEGALAIRSSGHPWPGTVHVGRVEQTSTGFTMEFEERWPHEGQNWYCREMIRADVLDDRIVEMAVYCTGDWDESVQREHAAAVRLIRPSVTPS